MTNTPSFADPGGTGASPSTTFATPTYNSNSNGTVKSYGNFGVITNVINSEAGLGGARQLQLGYVRF